MTEKINISNSLRTGITNSIKSSFKREPKEKIKIKWFSRLRVEMLIFTLVAVLGALLATLVIVFGVNIGAMAVYNDGLDKMEDELVHIFDEMESKITKDHISPDDTVELERLLSQYDQYYFRMTVGKQDELIEFLRSNEFTLIESGDLAISILHVNSDKLNLSYASDAFFEYQLSTRIINDEGFFIIDANYKPLLVFSQRTDKFFLVIYLIMFVIILSVYINKKLRNLSIISKGLDVMQGGDLEYEIKVKGKDEIAQVAWHINEMSAALKERLDSEQELEQTKNQLIANVSHDLRTPMTSITGYLALLKDQTMVESEEARNYIDICYNKADNLNHLVDQLFDYVLLTNHQLDIDLLEVDMNVFVGQVMDEYELMLTEHGFSLEMDLYHQPIHGLIDPKRWIRVFENLVSNAVKYGDNSEPISVVTTCGDDIELHMINKVKSTTSIEEGLVFERYFTSNRTDGKSGGLGLAICRQIIEQHDGSIFFAMEDGYVHITIKLPKVD